MAGQLSIGAREPRDGRLAQRHCDNGNFASIEWLVLRGGPQMAARQGRHGRPRQWRAFAQAADLPALFHDQAGGLGHCHDVIEEGRLRLLRARRRLHPIPLHGQTHRARGWLDNAGTHVPCWSSISSPTWRGFLRLPAQLQGWRILPREPTWRIPPRARPDDRTIAAQPWRSSRNQLALFRRHRRAGAHHEIVTESRSSR